MPCQSTVLPGTADAAEGPALRAFTDSGAPQGSTDYTTLVIIHGLGWHAPVFNKLLPLSAQFNARIVLVNRRDYPCSRPYTSDEHARCIRLASTPPSPEASAETAQLLAEHAHEICEFLEDFVRRERIPTAKPAENAGGIILVGWSLGGTSVEAVLAHVRTYPVGDIQLSKYVRRVIMYDPSCVMFGWPHPEGWYHTSSDESIPAAERAAASTRFLASYFKHGDFWASGESAIEQRNPAPGTSDTTSRMSAAELAACVYAAPGEVGGSDWTAVRAYHIHGAYQALKDAALYLREPRDGAVAEAEAGGADDWRDVEVRVLWCDRSIWEMVRAAYLLDNELREAKDAGKPLRNVRLVRFRGGNHFAHWDMPEETMRAFLGSEESISE